MRDDEEDADLDLDIDLDLDDEGSSMDDSSAGADATPAGGAQPGRRNDPEPPRTTSAAAGPPRRRISLWRAFLDWLRRHAVLAPSRCVVIGPSASGKTALLMSLDQCEQEQSHSFQQYSVLPLPVSRCTRSGDRWAEAVDMDGRPLWLRVADRQAPLALHPKHTKSGPSWPGSDPPTHSVAKAAWAAATCRLRAEGGGVLSRYCGPCRHSSFAFFPHPLDFRRC